MRRSLLAVLCLALSTICITSQLVAAPHYGTPWKFKQPDGTLVDVRVWGDEYYQVVETPDGYTLMRDPANDWIVYAKLSGDGNELVPTNVRYGSGPAALAGVSPHIRINPGVASAQARQMRELAFPETPAMRAGGEPKMAPPSTGNVVGLVLIADFSDLVATIPAADVENFCNQVGYNGNGNNGSIHDYFDAVSNGNLNYTLDVPTAYHRASQTWAYYDNCPTPWLQRAKELITEILTQMEADGTDFSVYDSNGDNEIDAINLYFAGNGTTCGWAKGMWPGAGGMGGSFSADGVSANRFQITDMGAALTMGTFCHENGHMVCGWPDLYDYDQDSEGVGKYDLMGDYASSTNPVEPGAQMKITAGWMTATDLVGKATGINLPLNSNNFAYRWAKSATEYYLIENRQQTGRDAAMPDAGLILSHIDTAKWIPGNGNDEQDMTPALHYYVTIVQADGDWDLENANNRGDSSDLFSSPNDTEVTDCTDPNTNWWDGTDSGLSITNISANSNTMTFDFSPDDDDPVALVKAYGADADENCCITVTVADINNGSNDPDGPGDIASLCITQRDGVDVGCQQSVSVCGDGDHTLRLTITDLCGNTDFADATVTVENEAPIAIAVDYTANADDQCCITVDVDSINGGSYDPDGGDDIKSICITALDGEAVDCKQSISVCGDGTHTVDITITDWCDSTSTATANVDVIDITPPDIEVSLDRDALWPPNHKLVEVCVDELTVTDNCDPDPEVALADIWSDEPDNDKGDGNTIGDIQDADFGTDDDCFSLRSERQGTENGRKYTVVYSATDNSGNVGYDTVCVHVPHDQSSNAICSSGFSAGGESLVDGMSKFAMFIPGSATFDVRKIDTSNIYVGNTGGVIRATETRHVDVNNDMKLDLAVMFDATDSPDLNFLSGLTQVFELDAPMDAQVINDGPVGMHFNTTDGKAYLVPNIYNLGTPVAMPDIAGKKTVTPEGESLSLNDAPSEAPKTVRVTAMNSVHPNPFNPQTTVDFSLAASAKVQIAIYDVKGSLIRRLVNETMPAGQHSARWNGMDDAGHTATSGIYFVRMIAGSYSEVRKIVMLK